MDTKKILKAANRVKTKRNYTFYLTVGTMNRVKELCKGRKAPLSRVVERVLVELLKGAD